MTRPIDRLLDDVEWRKLSVPDSGDLGALPRATHEGVLTFAGHTLRGYRLSNGQRVIDQEDLAAAFGVDP
jgi:hypothetical protein